jgi:hypothetical protein
MDALGLERMHLVPVVPRSFSSAMLWFANNQLSGETILAAQLILTRENGEIRLEGTYPLDFNGHAEISVLLPLINPTILEAQALACERAAAGLQRLAGAFRNQIADLAARAVPLDPSE